MSLRTVLKIYSPHQYQKEIEVDVHRFKVIACGRRFGKTTMSVAILLKKALKYPRSNFWYIAPTYKQAKNIAWRMLLNYYHELPAELKKDKNESELWIELVNGSRISLKGADNEDSLRGTGLHGLVVDEVASIRNWETLWEEVLRPALTDFRGWSIFISTPKGFNHFYDLFNKEQKDKDYKSFRYTSYDNYLLSKTEIDKAKEELTEDAFCQEYLADFRKQTGLIYKEFDRTVHIKEKLELSHTWQFYRTMDFGAVNPTVCLWIAVDNIGTVYVFDEYFHTGMTAQSHANVINAKTSVDMPVQTTWGDPSAKQEMLDYALYGVVISPALRIFDGREHDWVKSGIEKVREYLKPNAQTGRPRIYVDAKCVNLIREFETYHWLENQTNGIIKDVPDKVDDHCMDALRYFIVSYTHQPPVFYQEDLQTHYNSYTGY